MNAHTFLNVLLTYLFSTAVCSLASTVLPGPIFQTRKQSDISKQYYHTTHTQPFYGPFTGNSLVSRCQKRTSGLYGATED